MLDDEFAHEPTTETTMTTISSSEGIPTTSSATLIPSPANPPPSSTSSSGVISSSSVISRPSNSVYTTMVPVTTVTQPSTTFTSYSPSIVYSSSNPALPVSATPFTPTNSPSLGITTVFVCPGRGIDATAAGILAAVIIPSIIGLIIWVREPAELDI